MTKHSKDAHISDSASSGKGESMAMEIRSTEWTASEPLDYNAHRVTGFIEVAAPNDACFAALFPLRKDAEDYIAWKNSEKGLASRVEELEEALRLLVEAYDEAISSHPAEFVSYEHAVKFAAAIEAVRPKTS